MRPEFQRDELRSPGIDEPTEQQVFRQGEALAGAERAEDHSERSRCEEDWRDIAQALPEPGLRLAERFG